jgi:valyl-tRNA synthetase
MPFKHVYFTGIVRDKLHRKMSKSLGNSPDPLDLIKKYGADGVRVGMLLCSPAGNDLLFDESLTEQGRNFANKVWNIFRLIKNWEADEKIVQPQAAKAAVNWFESKISESLGIIDDHFSKFRISEALMVIYTLIKDEFSGWYLEAVKPAYQQPIDPVTLQQTKIFFEQLLKVLHPFMPFISEEIYQSMEERGADNSIMITRMPEKKRIHKKVLDDFEEAKAAISFIRTTRIENQIPNKETRELIIKSDAPDLSFIEVMGKLGNVKIEMTAEKLPIGKASSLITKNAEYYVILGEKHDSEAELLKLKAELEYAKGFLESVNKKLSNTNFVNNAPEKV